MNWLGKRPTRISTAGTMPTRSPAWFSEAGPELVGHREMLAPGVWVIRIGNWMAVSVLDVAEEMPDVVDVQPRRQRRDWSPPWHQLALCRGVKDADAIFFGVDDVERPALSPTAVKTARGYCSACPAARDCLRWALSEPEDFGIWGGTTGRQRRPMRAALAASRTTIEQLVNGWLGEPGPA